MPPAPRISNAFALLQEEKQVFRQKEKKEKALKKRETKLSLQQIPQKPVFHAIDEPVPKKWSEVIEDDDEDEEDDNYQDDDILSYDSSSVGLDNEDTQESDSESELESNIADTSNDATEQGSTKAISDPASKQLMDKLGNLKISNRQPSKKERKLLEKEAAEDFDALLNDMGLSPADEKISVPTNTSKANDTDKSVALKKKKKKRKTAIHNSDQVTVPAETRQGLAQPLAASQDISKSEVEVASVTMQKSNAPSGRAPAITVIDESKRDALLSAAKKGVTKKSKSSAALSNTVLEEAKKRSELKKAKQKREKHPYDH